LIETPTGPVGIENLHAGDLVACTDRGGLDACVVQEAHRSVAQGYYVINSAIRVTGTHPVRVSGGWRRVADLAVGDTIVGREGMVAVESVVWHDKLVIVYNLTVGGHHTFFAQGILVHNKPPNPGG
jgi:intein/homing endonuclease